MLGRASGTVWVRPDARLWVESVLGTAPTLHAAAARLGVGHPGGRGLVYTIQTHHGVWVLRHFRRGGSVARVLGDRYLAVGPPRPFLEAVASEAARARGVRTPRVVAAAVYRSGLTYRGDLMTDLVPDADELAAVLFDAERAGLAGAADRREAVAEAGAVVATLGRAGVHHPDLNAGNILLQWSGGSPVGHVLDLDRCRLSSGPVPVEPMLQRLLRSIRKWERRSGLKVPQAEVRLLTDAARSAA